MYPIFYEWKYLIQQIFSPNSLEFFKILFSNYLKSIKSFLIYFGWLLFIDATSFLIFGNYYLKATKCFLDPNKHLSPAKLIITLLTISIWFILPAIFLLTIRREGDVNWYYFKQSFLRYIQLKIILSFVFVVIFNLINLFGITVFPTIHWSLGVFVKLIELITILFWLDSSYRFIDIFYSVERSINFIIYQYPFFITLSIVWLPINLTLSALFKGFQINYHFYKIINLLEISKFFEMPTDKITFLFKIKFLLLRYLLFFMNYLFVASIYTFYSIKKRKIFAQSIINENIDLENDY